MVTQRDVSDGRRLGLAVLLGGCALSLLATRATAQTSAEPQSGAQLSEVIVTAEKKDERLLDVPIPVTSVNAAQLANSNLSRIQDYYTMIPGLTLTDMVGGTPSLVIRGITTGGFGNPTVGTTIDDAPVGNSTGTGGGYQAIELDPSDLQNIEVLRGPQGTLYGASSMGGLLKYVTRDPSTAGFSGHVEAAVEGVDNGDGPGGTVRGSLNAPVTENLAVSGSAFSRQDEGWIDDPTRGLTGVNKGHAYGGRFALLWSPSDTFSAKLNLIHQYAQRSASDDVAGPPTNGLGDFVAGNFIPHGSGFKQTNTFVDGVLKWRLAAVDLTSVTAYSDNKEQLFLDLPTLSAYASAFFGVTGVPYVYDTRGNKFSQEFRASIPIGANITWLVGGFYTRERSTTVEDIMAGDIRTGVSAGSLLTSRYPTTYREFAGFTDVTVKFTDAFDVQIGARQSDIRQTYSDVQTGPLKGPDVPTTRNGAHAFTYLLTPEYRFTPNVMAYVRVASGYRAGGPNYNAQVFGLPTSFKPDKTQNYEIGLKGSALSGRFTYDASIYYIDWKDIQIREVTTGFASVANAGGAKSEGVELSVEVRPLTGLTISAWGAWDDAELTSALPPTSSVHADAGDRLPYTSRFAGNVAARQEFALTDSLRAHVGASLNRVGDRLSDFNVSNVRIVLPAYTRVDLQAGVAYAQWRVDAFINNVGNVQGVIAKAYNSNAFHIIKPRTVGVSVSADF